MKKRVKNNHTNENFEDPSAGVIVTSRGCARSFVLCVLNRILKHVQGDPSVRSYPFDSDLIESLLKDAAYDCENGEFNFCQRDTKFNRANLKTYWTRANQFNTWWKNHINRKEKFTQFNAYSQYTGTDKKLREMAQFSQCVISMTTNIKRVLKANHNQFMIISTTMSQARFCTNGSISGPPGTPVFALRPPSQRVPVPPSPSFYATTMYTNTGVAFQTISPSFLFHPMAFHTIPMHPSEISGMPDSNNPSGSPGPHSHISCTNNLEEGSVDPNGSMTGSFRPFSPFSLDSKLRRSVSSLSSLCSYDSGCTDMGLDESLHSNRQSITMTTKPELSEELKKNISKTIPSTSSSSSTQSFLCDYYGSSQPNHMGSKYNHKRMQESSEGFQTPSKISRQTTTFSHISTVIDTTDGPTVASSSSCSQQEKDEKMLLESEVNKKFGSSTTKSLDSQDISDDQIVMRKASGAEEDAVVDMTVCTQISCGDDHLDVVQGMASVTNEPTSKPPFDIISESISNIPKESATLSDEFHTGFSSKSLPELLDDLCPSKQSNSIKIPSPEPSLSIDMEQEFWHHVDLMFEDNLMEEQGRYPASLSDDHSLMCGSNISDDQMETIGYNGSLFQSYGTRYIPSNRGSASSNNLKRNVWNRDETSLVASNLVDAKLLYLARSRSSSLDVSGGGRVTVTENPSEPAPVHVSSFNKNDLQHRVALPWLTDMNQKTRNPLATNYNGNAASRVMTSTKNNGQRSVSSTASTANQVWNQRNYNRVDTVNSSVSSTNDHDGSNTVNASEVKREIRGKKEVKTWFV